MSLTKFKGREVSRAAVEIPGAAGGLRDAMRIDPQEFEQGERVFIVLEAICQKVRYEPIDGEHPEGTQQLVHILKATNATFVDEDLVREQLDRQKARVALAKDEASGQQRLGSDAELDLQHFAGKHAKRRKAGCPSCELEKTLEAEEKLAARAEKANASAQKKAQNKVVDMRRGKNQA